MKTTFCLALYDDWLTPLREEYRRRISEVVAPSRHAVRRAEGIRSGHPLRRAPCRTGFAVESHHQLLIRLHAANHDRASALRAYHQCMRVLRREMGVEPGPATRELFERILKAETGASQ